MKLATRQQRQDMKLNELPMPVKMYIHELETELERTASRNGRLRKNIRSMQERCRLLNLIEKNPRMIDCGDGAPRMWVPQEASKNPYDCSVPRRAVVG
jgi:hypothetical protein